MQMRLEVYLEIESDVLGTAELDKLVTWIMRNQILIWIDNCLEKRKKKVNPYNTLSSS